ncbi:glycosyltransferase family 2 protein [Iningainema tapete]|uniref:Glycosyltransferase family 2 protein n=1 Tax=Iningainema tapete BLCC-T55 TaxID=2748662 RepID=A0A8J7CG85_9CYAN|nr:glycosyltransferase family A protein [Iningainema tapete]MBD2776040.1 glycosyltransferase family 2 protein [Iningainema tapete BLCC-T55]
MIITPKVSVIVPAYNVKSYIHDALGSLERQTLSEFEAIIVDDGSCDGTDDVVKPFLKRDARFKLLQKQNGGLSSARNYGIRHACGKYIALLDGDDVYHSDKLANHVAQLERNAEVGVVYSASRAIRDDGRLTFITLSGKPIHVNPILALLCKNFVGHGSNAVFRRCLVDEIGEFDEELRSWEDIDFWLRIAVTQKWRFYREKRLLSYYRVRPSGLSFNLVQMRISGEQVIQAAYRRSPDLIEPMLPTAYAYMYRYLARLCLQGGDTQTARDFVDQAFICDKSIFYQDMRSLLTLIASRLAPLSQVVIGRSLGKANAR